MLILKQIQNLADKLKATEELNAKANGETSQLYEREIALQKSRIDTLTSQYQNQLKDMARLNEEKLNHSKAQIETLRSEASKAGSSGINWLYIIVAIIIGILIGIIMSK